MVGVECDDALQRAHVIELQRLQENGSTRRVPLRDACHLAAPSFGCRGVILNRGWLADRYPGCKLLLHLSPDEAGPSRAKEYGWLPRLGPQNVPRPGQHAQHSPVAGSAQGTFLDPLTGLFQPSLLGPDLGFGDIGVSVETVAQATFWGDEAGDAGAYGGTISGRAADVTGVSGGFHADIVLADPGYLSNSGAVYVYPNYNE